MKTKLFTLISLIALSVASCFGQTVLSTTTLAAAVTSTNTTTLTLTSTSTMLAAGGGNQINTCMYIDSEGFSVVAIPVSGTVTVSGRGSAGGCGFVGLSTRPTTHNNGATVYFANTTTNGNFVTQAASLIGSNQSPQGQSWGSCTRTALTVVPRIYLFSGEISDCIGGQWVQTNDVARHGQLATGVTIPAGNLTPTGTTIITDTGTAAMTGIVVPAGWAVGQCLQFIPGGAFTTVTSGGLANIANATTAVASKLLIECWDGAKWSGSY